MLDLQICRTNFRGSMDIAYNGRETCGSFIESYVGSIDLFCVLRL